MALHRTVGSAIVSSRRRCFQAPVTSEAQVGHHIASLGFVPVRMAMSILRVATGTATTRGEEPWRTVTRRRDLDRSGTRSTPPGRSRNQTQAEQKRGQVIEITRFFVFANT